MNEKQQNHKRRKVASSILSVITSVLGFGYLCATTGIRSRRNFAAVFCRHRNFGRFSTAIIVGYSGLCCSIAIAVFTAIGFSFGSHVGYNESRRDLVTASNRDIFSSDQLPYPGGLPQEPTIADLNERIGVIREASQMAQADFDNAGFFSIDPNGDFTLKLNGVSYILTERSSE